MIDQQWLLSLDRKGLIAGATIGVVAIIISFLTLGSEADYQAPILTVPNIVAMNSDHGDVHAAIDGEEILAEPIAPLKTLRLMIANIPSNKQLIKTITETLPPSISLALSPYQSGLKTTIAQLRDQGRDVWVVLPSQTEASASMQEDLGPLSIHLGRKDQENTLIATTLAAEARMASGLVLTPTSVFPTRAEAWRPVSNALKDLDVTLLDTTPHMVAGDIMNSDHYLKSVMLMDGKPMRRHIAKQFEKLAIQLETQDDVSAILAPYPISLKILSEFLSGLDKDIVALKPFSSLVTLEAKAYDNAQSSGKNTPHEAHTDNALHSHDNKPDDKKGNNHDAH